MTRSHALRRAKDYNAQGIATSLSFLPVRAYSAKEVENDIEEYLDLFDVIPINSVSVQIHGLGKTRSPKSLFVCQQSSGHRDGSGPCQFDALSQRIYHASHRNWRQFADQTLRFRLDATQ